MDQLSKTSKWSTSDCTVFRPENSHPPIFKNKGGIWIASSFISPKGPQSFFRAIPIQLECVEELLWNTELSKEDLTALLKGGGGSTRNFVKFVELFFVET